MDLDLFLLFLFSQRTNWSTKSLGSMLKVTELVNGRTRIWNRAGWLRRPLQAHYFMLKKNPPVWFHVVVHVPILVATGWSVLLTQDRPVTIWRQVSHLSWFRATTPSSRSSSTLGLPIPPRKAQRVLYNFPPKSRHLWETREPYQ